MKYIVSNNLVMLASQDTCVMDDDTEGNNSNNSSNNKYKTINEAINISKELDEIYIEEGNYNEKIVINKELKIIGETDRYGKPLVNINYNTDAFENIIQISEKTNIKNLNITSTFGTSIFLFCCNDVVINNCNILSLNGDGFIINGSSNFLLKKCKIKSYNKCIFYNSLFNSGGEINECNLYSNDNSCIRCIDNSYLKIINCELESKNRGCISVSKDAIISLKMCKIYKNENENEKYNEIYVFTEGATFKCNINIKNVDIITKVIEN